MNQHGLDQYRSRPYHGLAALDRRPRRRRADAADVVFRCGAALFTTWVYLRTLMVHPVPVDRTAWTIFAWTGWPLVLIVLAGAAWTLASWMRGA